MKKYQLFLVSAIATFVVMVGGYNFSIPNLVLSTFALMVSIYFAEKMDVILKNGQMYLPILMIIMICFNGLLYFITDSKDFNVMLFIQVLWILLGTLTFFMKKWLLKNNERFFKEMIKWYSSLVILVLIERVINAIKIFNINIDIPEFITVIVVLKFINIFINIMEKSETEDMKKL